LEDSGFLRDAAECLHRLNRNEEALKFLARAKERESENPFVLGLESRILEDIGKLDAAYDSAELAAARDPLNERLHNRLGVIRVKQGRPHLAISHFQKAIELDPDQFSPGNLGTDGTFPSFCLTQATKGNCLGGNRGPAFGPPSLRVAEQAHRSTDDRGGAG